MVVIASLWRYLLSSSTSFWRRSNREKKKNGPTFPDSNKYMQASTALPHSYCHVEISDKFRWNLQNWQKNSSCSYLSCQPLKKKTHTENPVVNGALPEKQQLYSRCQNSLSMLGTLIWLQVMGGPIALYGSVHCLNTSGPSLTKVVYAYFDLR